MIDLDALQEARTELLDEPLKEVLAFAAAAFAVGQRYYREAGHDPEEIAEPLRGFLKEVSDSADYLMNN
ncbi:hypothetical protein [Mycolicibacterium houstonense]|uniref:hypothetical protein n=1 Tax=Mycolicibacterium houstonense TaxID=146021 RepID=UPI0008366283|nr:hypothetical protein [Mycolicibacterium houstonense]